MIIQQLDKKNILNIVEENVLKVQKEILATMLLKEERINPLPVSYHKLLYKKVSSGILLKRLGFGTKEDYNSLGKQYIFSQKNYMFKYSVKVSKYQRMLLLDREKLFFGINGTFFKSEYKPLIKAFLTFFTQQFQKGNYE